MAVDSEGVARRAVLVGAAAGGVVVALAGCQVYGRPPDPADGSVAAGGGLLGQVADIPVGGGTIFADKGVVVTQPQQGTIEAFSAVCTHQGCPVAEIAGGTINCTCHGSKFKITDGSVVSGPAGRPLAAVPVTIQDGSISLAVPWVGSAPTEGPGAEVSTA